MTAPDTTIDPGLQALATAAERRNIRTALTLVTTGGVVSGVLIGHRAWIEAFADEADTGEGSEQFRAELFDALSQETASQFIHLEHAAIHDSSLDSFELQGRILWRGRLADVVGWNISAP